MLQLYSITVLPVGTFVFVVNFVSKVVKSGWISGSPDHHVIIKNTQGDGRQTACVTLVPTPQQWTTQSHRTILAKTVYHSDTTQQYLALPNHRS